jgi:hypothetical protein
MFTGRPPVDHAAGDAGAAVVAATTVVDLRHRRRRHPRLR